MKLKVFLLLLLLAPCSLAFSADTKVTNLGAMSAGTVADADSTVMVDVSDTTMAASGTNKKYTWQTLKADLKTYFDSLYPLSGFKTITTNASPTAQGVADSREDTLTINAASPLYFSDGGDDVLWLNVRTNSADYAGVVSNSSGQVSKVWKTDAEGVPGWRDDEGGSVASTEVTASSTATLSTGNCTNTVISNYGQSATNVQTLPAGTAGLGFIVTIGTSGAGSFSLDPNAANKIYLNGTAQSNGYKVTNATPAVGDTLTCFSFRTGASTWDWICKTGSGTWVDGGA